MKNLFPIIMPLVFLAILVASNIYMSRRFAWAFSIGNPTYLYVLFAVIPLFMFTGLIAFSNSTSVIGSLTYIFAAVITGMMLYLLLSMLLLDLGYQVFKFKPFYFGALSLALSILISSYGILNARRTVTTRLEVPLKGLSSKIKLAHLSDIHLGHFRGKANLQELIDKAMLENPDILVITGDLFDGKRQMNAETLEPLSVLNVPVFFVEGNHDIYSGVSEIKQLLRDAGVQVLENEVAMHHGLQIVGLNHLRPDKDTESIPPSRSKLSIEEVLAGLDISDEQPALLLHHSPDGIKHANAHGIDFYLAGHTHAGQLFPMNHLNDLIFKYNRGLSNYNGTSIYVSRGTGTFGPPMRVGTTGEIPIITLTLSS